MMEVKAGAKNYILQNLRLEASSGITRLTLVQKPSGLVGWE